MPRVVWRDMPEYSNYEINRLGHIRNKQSQRTVKPYDDGTGYYRVKLGGKNLRVHILVAQVFCRNPNPLLYTQVNHKKGKKSDNRASQLEWVTPSENIKHAWACGLRKGKR